MTLPRIKKTKRFSEDALIRALWHKTRNVSVERTANELAEMFGETTTTVSRKASVLVREGYAKGAKLHTDSLNIMTYTLTHLGTKRAQAIAEAE